MPRQRDERRELAFKMWKKSNGTMLLKDIASKLECSDTQIRKWKSQDNWDGKVNSNVTKQATKKEHLKSNVTKQEETPIQDVEKVEDDIDPDGELNSKQRRFIQEYLIDLNAAQAAIRAGYSPKTAKEQGHRLLTNAHIKEAVENAKKKREKRLELSQEKVLTQIAKIAFSDIKDVLEWDETGGITIRPSDQVDGTIISELEVEPETRTVKKVKMNDRFRALIKLYDHLSKESALKIALLEAEIKAKTNAEEDQVKTGLKDLTNALLKSMEIPDKVEEEA